MGHNVIFIFFLNLCIEIVQHLSEHLYFSSIFQQEYKDSLFNFVTFIVKLCKRYKWDVFNQRPSGCTVNFPTMLYCASL